MKITIDLDYTPTIAPRRNARKYTSQERQCWRTPNTPEQPVLHLVARALGGEIGIDPTADEARSVPAHKHITAAEDCFSWPWVLNRETPKTAFMNPPFDKPHLYLQALVDNTCRSDTLDQSIALLKTGTLHNQKSGAIIKANANAVCHWGAGKVGRMGFIDCDGYQVAGADFDTVLVYFGKDPFLFCQVFDHYGLVSKVVK